MIDDATPKIDPQHTVLLVMDYQPGIVSRMPDPSDLLRRAREAIATARSSGVVLSTVRDAADRDYRVFVLEDASADPDREAHDFLTQRIFPRQAYVVSVAELGDLVTTP